MKILVITQKIDKDDPVLGFFHRWIEELAKKCSYVTIICLFKGACNLPDNVNVLSLGKENGSSKIKYVLKFWYYIINERKNYKSIFVHMNQEYVLLGGLIWKLFNKNILMWRNHPNGNLFTNIAVLLSNRVFCTSPSSYTARFKKTKMMPAGIDIDLYESLNQLPENNSILFLGRLSPIKNVHLFIEALYLLKEENINFHADIIGSASNSHEEQYRADIEKLGDSLVKDGVLSFVGSVKHDETGRLYGRYTLYVNLTPDGSLDKTILESCAAKTPVLIYNSAFAGGINQLCQLGSLDVRDIASGIKRMLQISNEERKTIGVDLRDFVRREHSLKRLIEILLAELATD